MALGAPRLGLFLHMRAHRDDPANAEALYFRARGILSLRGAFAAWKFMRGCELAPAAPVEVRADWLALQATVATGFRDFAAAEKRLAEAEALCPDRPWIAVERTTMLEAQDRLPEALARISATLSATPLYRPGVDASARLLERLGRFDEAVELLRGADAELEAGSVAAHLAQILIDLERPREALSALARYAELSPLLESPGKAWLAARRSDAAYALGDLETARREAEDVADPFYAEIARRLTQPPETQPKRVLLAVPFLQQEHLTCSPTALASLTHYWRRPVDHVALASLIAYDGTPGRRERQWARANGWRDREFRLTSQAALALLDQGIPFTLTTQQATSAHAQAVAGCDPLRGTLLVRDPSGPRLQELLLEPLLEQQATHGPRCLALLPDAAEGPTDLPDEGEYDAFLEFELFLESHLRGRAQAIRDELNARQPDHLLRLFMDVRLLAYDDDSQALLPVYESLSSRFPQSEVYALRRVDLLLQLGHREEAMAALLPRARSCQSDPVFAIRLAEVLAGDARQELEARRLLERALRQRPADALALSALGHLVDLQGRREEAFELFRLSACTDIHDEGRVGRFVATAQVLGRVDEAVGFLRERVTLLGDRSSAPARSLFRGLEDLGRIDEALAALEQALERHPHDGELLLFVAEAQGRYGRLTRAQQHLAEAVGRARESDRRRTEARLSRWAGDLRASLAAWSAVAEAEPLALDAQRATAELLERLDGRVRALEHVAAAAGRAPTHLGLQRLRVEWLRADPPSAEQALRALLAQHPTDAWSHRELALVLSNQARFEEALAALDCGAELEPEQASTLGVRGLVLADAGRGEEAAQSFREAVVRAVDYTAAVDGLLDATVGLERQREALRFLAAELIRQRPTDSVFRFQRRCRGILDPPEVLASLEAVRAAHSDLWQPLSAIADQLTEEERLDEANRILEEATRRFPLVATLWLDRANVCSRQGDALGEVAFLERAIEIAPGSTLALQRLGEALRRHGRFADAAATLRRALAFDPVDSSLAGLLAAALRHAGEEDAARDAFERAVALDPTNQWAWNSLTDLAGDEAATILARRIATERPRDIEAQVALARQLPATAIEEQLAILDQVLDREPRHVDAHDLRATLLAGVERYGEALDACSPPVYEGAPPFLLQGRRAWVLEAFGRRREAMDEMKEVVERHPDYQWGIRLLAEWAARHGTPAEEREAAERFVRVSPDSPAAYTARGAARLRLLDQEGGCADLERALTFDPGFAEASARLFDAHLTSSRFDEAEGLLSRQVPYLTDEQQACRFTRLQAARGNRQAALSRLTAILRAGKDLRPALAPAVRALHEAFSSDAVIEAAEGSMDGLHPESAAVLVEVLVGRGSSADARRLVEVFGARPAVAERACRAWLATSSSESDDRFPADRLRQLAPEDPEALTLAARAYSSSPPAEQLRLYEEVLRLDPAQIEARDYRAMLLAQARQLAEARAACQKLETETETPPALRARAAWIEANAGWVQEARRMMRRVVADHPWHGWSWDRLLEWDFREETPGPSYLEDAEAYAAAFPGEPGAYGYLGDALRRSRRPREAEAAFRRSIELDPAYEWGRLALADLLLGEGRAADAESVLRVPEPTGPVLIRRIRVAFAQGGASLAETSFVELLSVPGVSIDTKRRGRDAFLEVAGTRALRWAFEKALGLQAAPDDAASLASEWFGSQKEWRRCEAVLRRCQRDRLSLYRAALCGCVRALRSTGDRRRLKRLVRRHREALRGDDFLWGLAGHALSFADDRATVHWMEDWAKRKTTPWVLNSLAISLRHLRNLQEALRVSRHALRLPEDHVTPCHRAWIGIELALEGGLEEAESLLSGLEPPEEVKAFYDALTRLAQAAIVMRRSRRAGYEEAKVRIREATRLAGRTDLALLPLHRRTVDLVVRLHGGFGAWLWRFLGAN